MSDVALPLFVETVSGNLVTADGSTLTLPDGKLGDTWVGALRFVEKQDSSVIERALNVIGIKVAIGPVLAPPASGSFKLSVNGGVTGAIDYAASAESFLTALGEGVGLSCTKPTDGCWIVRLTGDGEAAAELEAADDSNDGYNTLSPQSAVRCRSWQENGLWYHEVRLIQTPYAFADSATAAAVEIPEVTRVLAGNEESDSEPARNEIQRLHIPADFKGTFYLTFSGRRSVVIGELASLDIIANALNGMFDDDLARFSVTNPEAGFAYIEFIGALGGAAQSLIDVAINTAAPGALTFRLPLDRPAMYGALRVSTTVTTVFEIEIRYIGLDEDIEDDGVEVRKLTAQLDVKLIRELIYDELALVPSHNWLRAYRRAYIPFSPDAVITGSQRARFIFPATDEVGASVFNITHGMATDEIDSLLVRENISNGRILQYGEYTARIVDENQIELTFASAPLTENSLVVIISTINNVATFADHFHPIARIIGDTDEAPTLREELDALSARILAIENLISVTGSISRTQADAEEQGLELPMRRELYPGRYTTIPALDGTVKLKAAGLLPAIHDATATAFTVLPLPDPGDFTGSVLYNDTGAAIEIPGGLGRRATMLPAGGFFGSDGRLWYRLTNEGETNSFFPTDFERELWMLAINDRMLRPGMIFRVDGAVKLRLLAATTRMQCVLIIEIGTAPSEAAPSPTAPNLENVVWNTGTPLLKQRIVIGDIEQKHTYGCAVLVSDEAVVTALKFLYGASSAADQVPASANFVIRARLKDFDTENSVTGARGLVWFESTGATFIK